MPTLEEMASKGFDIYSAKIPTMKTAYKAAEGRAKTAYSALPFGPTRTAAYTRAWTFMPGHYDTAMKPEVASTWRDRWIAKMRE